jgi:two-component system sensor histidine kinase VicK
LDDIAIEDGRTKILYGVENALSYGKKFMDNAKVKMDITYDHHGPSIVIKIPLYYEGYKDILKRGGKIRCITEINKDNKDYCKELLNIVSELRHLDGLKGGIAINESEYMATTVLKEEQPLTEVIYSNAREVVSQNQYIFDTFWKNAIPAIKKIKEIEEGVEIEFVEVINDALKARDLYIKNLKSSTKELLLLIPSNMIYAIKKEIGFFEIVNMLSNKLDFQIMVLLYQATEATSYNKEIDFILSNEKIKSNTHIRTLDKDNIFKSLDRTAIAIIDRKLAMVLELKDNLSKNFGSSIVFSIYSNNKIFVSSYISIFESLWKYIDLIKKLKETEKELKNHENNLEKQIQCKTQNLSRINEELKELNREFERKEKELKKTNRELIETENKKEEFISMIAHELRSPLVPIKGYAEMLLISKKMGQLTDIQKKALQSIYRNVKKQESLVEDILDVYKLDLGKIILTKQKVSILNMFTNVLNDLKSILEEKQISIITEINTKSIVYCDQKRIEQVLSNLIKNSIDFVPEKNGKIILVAKETKETEKGRNKTYYSSNIMFTIQDNGPGIPHDKIGNLFKKFYQMDTSATRKHTGTGLGLVICKGLIEAHRGRIWIDNNYKDGFKIMFSIPQYNNNKNSEPINKNQL